MLSDEMFDEIRADWFDDGYMFNVIEGWTSRVDKLERVARAAQELHKEWWCEELSEDFMPEELVKLDEALKELEGETWT